MYKQEIVINILGCFISYPWRGQSTVLLTKLTSAFGKITSVPIYDPSWCPIPQLNILESHNNDEENPIILKKPSWSVVLTWNDGGNDCSCSFQESSLKKEE